MEETKKRRGGGFASMSPERVRELASMGGKASHASGRAHQFTHDEAVVAGKKGGNAPHRSRGRSAQTTTSE